MFCGGTLGRGTGVDGGLTRGSSLAGTLGRSLSVVLMGQVALVKMSLSCLRAILVCVSTGGSKGCRWDLRRAAVRSLAAAMMVSLAVAVGILMVCGNQSTVLTMRVALVDGVQMVKHR